MSGIYGDFLDFFPELFDYVAYFETEPKVGAGYEKIATGYADAVVLTEKTFMAHVGKSTQTDSNDIISASDREYCFAPAGSPLKVGFCIIHPESEELYVIIGKSVWDKEAGFTKYEIQLLQGSTGEEEPVQVNPGRF